MMLSGLFILHSASVICATSVEDCYADEESFLQYHSQGKSPCNYALQGYCGPWWIGQCAEVPFRMGQMSGAFYKNVTTPPPPTGGDAINNYIVIGGQDVVYLPGQPIPSVQEIVGWMSDSNADNANIDMSGFLDGEYASAKNLADGIRSFKPKAKVQMTLQADADFTSAAAVANSFDTVGIMLYNISMTAPGFSIPEVNPTSGKTYALLQQLIQAGVPNHKIVLGMTTNGLEGYMVDFFKSLAQTQGFAGLMFWEIQRLPSTIPVSCIINFPESCGRSPSPPPPSACHSTCAPQSNLSGECCDLTSTTPLGSCFEMGPESCCGGDGLSPYFCLPTSVTAPVVSLLQDASATIEEVLLQDSKATDVLQAYCGAAWLTSCSLVPYGMEQLVGAYAPSVDIPPPRAGGMASDNSIVIGGEGVEGTLPTSTTLIGWMEDSNADNIVFDMEGVLRGNFLEAAGIADAIKVGKPASKSQATCLATTYGDAAVFLSSFDLFNIMLYADEMTGSGFSIPENDPKSGETYAWIKKWTDAGIPANKIVLGMTTAGLEGYMVDFFKSLVATEGFAGISFWKIGQLSDTGIPVSCITDAAKSCGSSPSPTPPSPDFCSSKCSGASPAAGQCCEKSSTTTYGSCYIKGQEGCCGGTGFPPYYCQLVPSPTPGPVPTPPSPPPSPTPPSIYSWEQSPEGMTNNGGTYNLDVAGPQLCEGNWGNACCCSRGYLIQGPDSVACKFKAIPSLTIEGIENTEVEVSIFSYGHIFPAEIAELNPELDCSAVKNGPSTCACGLCYAIYNPANKKYGVILGVDEAANYNEMGRDQYLEMIADGGGTDGTRFPFMWKPIPCPGQPPYTHG